MFHFALFWTNGRKLGLKIFKKNARFWFSISWIALVVWRGDLHRDWVLQNCQLAAIAIREEVFKYHVLHRQGCTFTWCDRMALTFQYHSPDSTKYTNLLTKRKLYEDQKIVYWNVFYIYV
jgi:hypothetical protein